MQCMDASVTADPGLAGMNECGLGHKSEMG